MSIDTGTDLEPEEETESDDEELALSADDWSPPLGPASESRRAAFRRAIEIAREERALRAALDDFSDNG